MEEILDYEAAAKMTGLPAGTLRALGCRKQIPHYRIGKWLVRFKQSELEQWLRNRHIAPLYRPNQKDGAPTKERLVDAYTNARGAR
jgi:excisionase family DNA binding protein